jgi:hypothetical protein
MGEELHWHRIRQNLQILQPTTTGEQIMKTATRHPLTISYTVMVPDEVIQHIKDSDGTRYWAEHSGDFEVRIPTGGDIYLKSVDDPTEFHIYNTESCLRGIALWIQNGHDVEQLLEMDSDHDDHDHIWQYAFFGDIVYG